MKIQNKNVHHGARFIDAKSVSQLIPGIDNIGNNICQFRSVAFNYNKKLKSDKRSNELNNLAPERFNNTLSIIGQRGDGKTSTMMTFIEEIKNGRYFKDTEKSNNRCDIITRIIDPDEISESSDFLGWVMTCIGEYLNSYSKSNQNDDKYYQDCIHLQGIQHMTSNLDTKLNDIYKLYTSVKKEYSGLIYSKSNSLNEYSDKFKTLLTNDYQFSQKFRDFITELIDFKREENRRLNYREIEAEPLIYFFFDDVDTSSKYCPEILINILTFLCHPNIVVCVSGDYEIFEKSVTKYLLDTSIYLEKDYQKELASAQSRSEFFLKKALPSSYRYRIVNYTNEILFNMSYCYKTTTNPEKLEQFNILQLISYVFGLGFINDEKNQVGGYLKSFIIPNINDKDFSLSNNITNINDYYFCNNEVKTNYVYAYLSVFGKNVRSFVNVYNYLYSEAISVCENQNSYKKQTISEYWNTDRFSEFINIIIESKFTYLKHRRDINKFLSIKYDKIENSNNIEDAVRNLRIDCEELEILVKNILNEEKKTILNDKHGEINSLIVLAFFINEIFYYIHRDNYYLRYKRIAYKLKNILCKVLINSQNPNIQLLPTTLDLRRTLCIYYRIISRMGIETLNKIVYPDFNNMGNVSRITIKKYFVQLYYAVILLVTASEKKTYFLKDTEINPLNRENRDDLIDCVKVNNFYDLYEKSTYQESIDLNGNKKKREDFEKVIIRCLKKVFDLHQDSNWFNDKIIYIKNMYPSIDSIMSNIENKYLNDYLIGFDDITNIKKSIYDLNANDDFFSALIMLLKKEIDYSCNRCELLLGSSEKVALIKDEVDNEKLKTLFLWGFTDKCSDSDEMDDEVNEYYRILMKFKREFEIKLNSYLKVIKDGNKAIINYKLKEQKKIIDRNIGIYYLLIFIIEYVVSYDTVDAKFFLNLKKELTSNE